MQILDDEISKDLGRLNVLMSVLPSLPFVRIDHEYSYRAHTVQHRSPPCFAVQSWRCNEPT